MEIARDLCTFQRAPDRDFSRLNFGIPGLERGCRHLGVRQSEDNQMVPALLSGCKWIIGGLPAVGFRLSASFISIEIAVRAFLNNSPDSQRCAGEISPKAES